MIFPNTTPEYQTDELHQERLPTTAYMVIGLMMTTVSVAGIFLNGLIVYIFWRQTSLNTPTNYFILALSILDCMMSLFGLPMIAISSFGESWVFGDRGCVYYGFIMTFLGLSVISILTIISVDRYIVIVKTHLKPFISRRVAVGMILGCILYALAWAVAPLFGWSKYVLEGMNISCSVNWNSDQPADATFSIAMLLLCLVVPLGFICFCYGHIFYKVRRTRYVPTNSDDDRGTKLDRDVAKTIIWMIAAFMLSWFPYAILSLIVVTRGSSYISPGMTVCPTVMAKVSVVWNPLIYTYRNRDIRKSMVEICPFLTCLFRVRSVRLHEQVPVTPDISRNVAVNTALPTTSTAIDACITRTKRDINRQNRQRQGRQPDANNAECEDVPGKTTSLKIESQSQIKRKAICDMFTVHHNQTTL